MIVISLLLKHETLMQFHGKVITVQLRDRVYT